MVVRKFDRRTQGDLDIGEATPAREGPPIVSGIKEVEMPLLTKMLPLRETADDIQAASLQSQPQETASQQKNNDSGYEDLEEYNDDECLSSDMEGSVIHRGRPRKPVRAPTIPTRNEKRTSKLLESVVLELKNLGGSESKDADSRSMVQESDPHGSYLSSEEDASLSDDYEDSLYDFEGTSSEDATEEIRKSTSTHSRKKSQEDTARVISFISVGKPQMIDIFISSNHTSPVEVVPKRHSMNLDTLTSLTKPASPEKFTRRPTPLKLYPASIRRMSISSMTSSHTSNSSSYGAAANASMTNLTSHPPRKSSRLALNINSLVTNTRNTLSASFSAPSATPSHSFLSSDPFGQETEQSNNEEPMTPKTPTSVVAAAFKRGLTKTLAKARKPSMPKLSMAYGNSSTSNLSSASVSPEKSRASRRISTVYSNHSSNNLARILSESNPAASENNEKEAEYRSRSSTYSDEQKALVEEPEVARKEMQRAKTMTALSSPPPVPNQNRKQNEGPIRYEDIMKGVIRGPPPIPISSTAGARKSFGLGMGLGGRKSVKAK